MTKISTVKARENFSELINQAAYGKQKVILTRRGKALAALVSMEDYQMLQHLHNNEDVA